MDPRFFEREAYRRGYGLVSGIDEVGRGPLAGPVVAAAVILPRHVELPEVKDSKDLTAAQRDACCTDILACASAVGIGCVEAVEIDRVNILQATFKAMLQAVEKLTVQPDFLLIDGPYTLPSPIPQKGIPQGDQRSLTIATASIVAKVKRDRVIEKFDLIFPGYSFKKNKGYGTSEHINAIKNIGPSPIHRKTYEPVAGLIDKK